MDRLRDVLDVVSGALFAFLSVVWVTLCVVLGVIAFARGSIPGGVFFVALLALAIFNVWNRRRKHV